MTLLTQPARVPRSSWSISMSVWKALFLREALSRLFASRTSWFWLFAEPVLHVSYLMFMFTVIRVRSVGGIEAGIFVLVGLIAFFLFRRVGTQVANAIAPNRALFAYRQVKPIDSLLVRGVLEAMLLLVIGGLLLFGAYL
ncbi:MAG: ABC transporter, partial [Comamonadaceae bacterium]